MKRKMYTIGYTGFDIHEFVRTLEKNDIECLIDIREIPLSRKPGFSKTPLTERLAVIGIEYRHFRALGSPRADRHTLRATQDYPKFFRAVEGHLQTEDARADLVTAIATAKRFRSCLMCCCPDWQFCHRRPVVEAIQSQASLSFEHLGAPESSSEFRKAA